MSGRNIALAVSAAVALIAGGLALRTADLGQQPWLVSRASGVVAFALLSTSVVFGLLLSTRLAARWRSARATYELHGMLSVFTLVFLGLHAGALLFDGFLAFTPAGILVPFMSPYAPFWVALGTIAGWSTAALAASARFRKQMGYRRWRQLHYLSFGAWLLALVHGVGTGTDTAVPGVAAMYVLAGVAVMALLAVRMLAPAPRRTPAPTRAGAAAGTRPMAAARGVRKDAA